jgi:transcriptional regulator with XRE-family HTH domain
MSVATVEELVCAARNGRSQKVFAQLLGVKQSSVSRYEAGKTNPPKAVIESCMRLVHEQGATGTPSAEQLARRVCNELDGPACDEIRAALSGLVDAFVAARARHHEERLK